MKTCYFCKGSIEIKRVEHLHHWKGKMYLFQNVKAEVCNQCGEIFLFPESIQYMDQIVQQPDKAETEIKIPVFSAPNSLPV